MQPPAVLPMMLPMRLRNHREGDERRAQELFTAFRDTPFSPRSSSDPHDSALHGPGELFRDEVNSMATRAQLKNLSLYKTERDVNPTVPPAVDAIYRANEASDLALVVGRKGNIAAALKSASPRFVPTTKANAPGGYSPERFTGAFPILSDRVTPSTVREEKHRARDHFDRSFAIAPAPATPRLGEPSAFKDSPGKLRMGARTLVPTAAAAAAKTTTDNAEWNGLQSAPLKPALTPKNAYAHHANRQLVLQHSPAK